MDRRTRIFATVFGVIVVYALVSTVAYPRWIEPLFTIDEETAERRQELDRLEKIDEEAADARREYRGYLNRVGSFDPVAVENDLRERLNELIAKHHLDDQNVTTRQPTADRKTNIMRMVIAITATGTLEATVGFLKDIVELPHLVRVGSAAVYPASSSRRKEGPERMNLRVPLEVLILPQQRTTFGERLADEDLVQPDSLVRHEGGDYSVIWEHQPFTEYVPPKPLVADAGGASRTVNQGVPLTVQGTASGGVGDYTYRWTPAEGLGNATAARTSVDTATLGSFIYTLTVIDEVENSATDTVTVEVREAPQPVALGDDEGEIEPDGPAGPKRWRANKDMYLRMALIHTEGDERLGEVMVYNARSREASFYETGDEFDGGRLVFVHPRGGVVRREDEYFVYPIGAGLDDDLGVEEAVEYPELQRIARWFSDRPTSEAEEPEPATEGEHAGEVALEAAGGPGDEAQNTAAVPGPVAAEAKGEKGGPAAPDSGDMEAAPAEQAGAEPAGAPPAPEGGEEPGAKAEEVRPVPAGRDKDEAGKADEARPAPRRTGKPGAARDNPRKTSSKKTRARKRLPDPKRRPQPSRRN